MPVFTSAFGSFHFIHLLNSRLYRKNQLPSTALGEIRIPVNHNKATLNHAVCEFLIFFITIAFLY